MKKTLVLLSLVTLNPVFADQKAEKFAANKKLMVENIERRIESLQAHKECINNSSSKKDFKACREKMKMSLKEHREKAKQARKEMKNKK